MADRQGLARPHPASTGHRGLATRSSSTAASAVAYAHPAQASSDLRRARRLDPLSTAPYEAQAALARPPADIPPLRAAVGKEPRQVDLRYELGLAYLRAGRKAAAVRELEAALRLDPRSEDVVRALRSARGR